MEITDRKSYFIVHCTEEDIMAYNSTRPARLPFETVTFGFTKGSGQLLRVIPNKIRVDMTVWGLAELAFAEGLRMLRNA